MNDASLTGALRNAVASGEFERAASLWTDYLAGLHKDLRQGSLSRTMLTEAGELLEWSRRVLLCSRAHAQDRLNNLHVAGKYVGAPAQYAPRRIQTRF